MGIYKQPNRWACGPFALKHALLMHGILASEWEIGRLAGTNSDGTDEKELERAARTYGCKLPTFRRHDPDDAREELVGYLREGIPCLLCVYEWDHWVTAIHEERGKYIILDSEQAEVIDVVDWSKLQRLWVYHDGEADTDRTLYDLHPLIPKQRIRTRARFSLQRANHLQQPENRRLAQLWDVYVEDLITVCRPQRERGGRRAAFGEFLRRHAEMILDELAAWHGQIDRAAAAEILERLRFVADTYGLVIRRSAEKRTISAVSIILALWSASEFGVEPLYRRVPVRKIR